MSSLRRNAILDSLKLKSIDLSKSRLRKDRKYTLYVLEYVPGVEGNTNGKVERVFNGVTYKGRGKCAYQKVCKFLWTGVYNDEVSPKEQTWLLRYYVSDNFNRWFIVPE